VEHIEIAPLARRLAEENNVEWRRLRGSGERGRVVERDVLEFLARVMAGDEELDPTPEPVPEGMQSWPEEDVRAFERERTSEVIPPIDGTSTVDDEIFLLDGDDDGLLDLDAGAGERSFAERHLVRTPVSEDAVELAPMDGRVIDDFSDDDDLLVEGDDVFAEPAPRERDASERPTSSYGRSFDPGTGSRSSHDLPDLFDDRPATKSWNDVPVFGDEGLGEWKPRPGPDLNLDDAPSRGETGPVAPPSLGIDLDDRADASHAREPDASHAREPDASHAREPDAETLDLDTGPEEGEPLDLDAGSEGAAPPELDAGAVPHPEHDPAGGSGHRADPEPREPFTRIAVAPVEARAGTDASLHVTAGASGETHPQLPLVHHGVVFRRQVNLSALVAAQADVARDLGLDEPVPMVVFLARAAAKALEQGSHVGVVSFDERDTHVHVADVLGSFSDVVRSFSDQAAVEGSHAVDLIVADLSDLELDEAVLHLDAPVLSLGRVLVDTSTGGRRATLVLSGDGIGRDAGRLLARTAELLETPIRVVL
jgi:hypothetical protein